jgi:hypothetical protein
VGEEDVARHLHRLGERPQGGLDAAEVVLADGKPSTTKPSVSWRGWSGKVVEGVITPASSAAAAVKAFMIEPGT